MRTQLRLACLGTVALLAFSGCATQPLPSPSTPAVVPANAERDVNPQPRDRLRDGGLLRFPVTALPTEWNPRHPDAAGADTQRVLGPLTPAHFELDAAGRASANPDFITEARVEHAGATTVTLELNERAVWGDATPVTADDWVATWRAASGQVAGVRFASGDGWDRVAGVRPGASEHEVVVTYAGVDPDWAEPLVAGPLRADTLGTADAFSWASVENARYAAPFSVTHVDKVQGLVTLERNPLWWGDPPKLETIMFRTVQPQALAAAFQHNELDVWETGTSTDRLQQTRAAADTALRTAPGTRGRLLRISTAGVLADRTLRRGLLMALDRQAVAAADLADTHKAPPVWSSTLLLPTQPGYADQARATGLGGDPAQAAKALDDAGWAMASGLRVKQGRTLSLTFRATADDPLAASEFAALSSQLARLGVSLSAVASDADLTPLSVPVSPFPLAHLPAGTDSLSGASELIARVRGEVDPVRRADQASQLARLAWQEVPEIPLYQEPQFVAVRNGLANLGAPGYSTTSWEDVGWTS